MVDEPEFGASFSIITVAAPIERIPAGKLEAATEEWKGERLGTLLGFKHTKAPNQVTGYLCSLFFAESTRESIVEAVDRTILRKSVRRVSKLFIDDSKRPRPDAIWVRACPRE